MRYTALRVSLGGVILYDFHVERLAPEGPAALAAFARFAHEAAPGAYTVSVSGGDLRAEPRQGTRLVPGMPTRLVVSPFAEGRSPFPKPASPSRYDGVREPGVATLLTSADGSEIYESCVAAVLGWDGARFVCVPDDRPRVASVAETALRAALPFVRRPLFVAGTLPLLLVNAISGPCAVNVGRPAFPDEAVALLGGLVEGSARRPER